MNLKKTLIASAVAAVAAAPVASYAASTLYGQVEEYYAHSGATTDGGKASSTFGDNGSRLGVMGSDMVGNGLTSFYKIETTFAAVGSTSDAYSSTTASSLKTRKAYIGVKGDFGAVVAGRQGSQFYNFVVGATDPSTIVTGTLATPYMIRELAISYTGSTGDFSYGVAYAGLGTNSSDKQQGGFDLGGKYTFGPAYVSAGYASFSKYNTTNAPGSGNYKSAAGISAGYSFGMFGLDGTMTKTQKSNAGTKADQLTAYTVVGSMNMGSISGFVQYSTRKSAVGGAKAQTTADVGVVYAVNKPLSLTFQVGSDNKYLNAGSYTSATGYKSSTTVGVDMTYAF